MHTNDVHYKNYLVKIGTISFFSSSDKHLSFLSAYSLCNSSSKNICGLNLPSSLMMHVINVTPFFKEI